LRIRIARRVLAHDVQGGGHLQGDVKLAKASGFSTKQIASIERGRVKKIEDEDLQRLFDALGCSRAEVILVTACLEAFAELDPDADPALVAAQERYFAAARRRLRSRMRAPGEAAVEAPSEYPCPYEVELDRIEAGGAWERLRKAKSLSEMIKLVRSCREYLDGPAFQETEEQQKEGAEGEKESHLYTVAARPFF
jgi:transcriptional regulator with XRE-family HTH domain